MRTSRGRTGRLTAGAVVLTVIAAACSDTSDDDPDGGSGSDGPVQIEVLSSQPEYVTGGSALVAVTLDAAAEIEPADVEISAGDVDVTDVFSPDPDQPERLVGLIEDLDEGPTDVQARAGDDQADVTLTNHPTSGPLFAGEPLPLVECTTEQFGLERSTPADDCFAPTEVTWEYVDTEGEVRPLHDPEAVPDDAEVAEIEGQDGEEVPLVIRHETGVLNRAVYRITKLEGAWNERLVYRFGGGCGTTFSQGTSWTDDPPVSLLRQGYAMATATFNTFATLCNDLISAETASMVKEHFVETYGVPAFTIGEGGSGGAIQQLLLAQNQPGLLDGIAPSLPFPDALTISPGVVDCRLLVDYYATGAGAELSEEQRTAVNGHATAGTCQQWDSLFVDAVVNPTVGCAGDDIYDPQDNPDGLRCTTWETNVAITGRDPETGFARPGFDNTGVQYGLVALNEGVITVDQFLDLNQDIGGLDIDGQPQPERSLVEDELVEGAYSSGRVVGPWGGIPDTPIILVNVYTDPAADIHDRVRSFSVLDRLAGGEDGAWPETVSLWTLEPGAEGVAAAITGAIGESAAAPTRALDEWLTAAREHQAAEGGTWQEALAAAKPESAASRCLFAEEEEIVGADAHEDSTCAAAFPVHAEPRMAAGGPRAGDLLKCQLVSVDEAEDLYEVEMTPRQLDRLAEIFPDGVCDYDQPGVGYGPPADVWQTFNEDPS